LQSRIAVALYGTGFASQGDPEMDSLAEAIALRRKRW